MLEMPVQELRSYTGINPKPSDFEEFWDSGLSRLREISPSPQFTPATFRTSFAQGYDLHFMSVGDALIHAKVLRPLSGRPPYPAVLFFHGYGANSGDWFSKLPYVAAGFLVFAMDCRGQAGGSQDPGSGGESLMGHVVRGIDGPADNMLYHCMMLDTAQLAHMVLDLPEVDPSRVYATGPSQGGGLTLACAALEPRISRAAPVFPFLSDYRRTWNLTNGESTCTEIRDFFRKFDPLHEREEWFFNRLGYIDVQYLCPRIKAKVLMGTGLRDVACPPSTQFAAYNKINSPKNVILYPDYGHEPLPGHDDRVFSFLTER